MNLVKLKEEKVVMEVQENKLDIYLLENCKACEILRNNLYVALDIFKKQHPNIEININVFEIKSSEVNKYKKDNIVDFPTVKVIRNNKIVYTIIGSVSKIILIAILNDYFNK